MLALSVIPRGVAMHRACGEKFGQDTPAKIEFLWRGRIVGEFPFPVPDRELRLHVFPPRLFRTVFQLPCVCPYTA